MGYFVIWSGAELIGVRPDDGADAGDRLRALLSSGVSIEWFDGPVPDLNECHWSPTMHRLIPPPGGIPRREFLGRLDPLERFAIQKAGAESQTIDYLWQRLLLAPRINPREPETMRAFHLLEKAGLIGRGRAEEILAP